MVGEVNKVVFREREELVIGSSSWLDEKGGGKACSRDYSYDQPETGQLELSYWESNPTSSIARKRTSFSSAFLLYSVYSANSHRERERLQGTNVIIDLSRHNERSRARFSNPSLPPSHYPKLPESSSNWPRLFPRNSRFN